MLCGVFCQITADTEKYTNKAGGMLDIREQHKGRCYSCPVR